MKTKIALLTAAALLAFTLPSLAAEAHHAKTNHIALKAPAKAEPAPAPAETADEPVVAQPSEEDQAQEPSLEPKPVGETDPHDEDTEGSEE
jgi:hypothetical protein